MGKKLAFSNLLKHIIMFYAEKENIFKQKAKKPLQKETNDL